MQIKLNLSLEEQQTINRSKSEKFEDPGAITNGYELARLIRSVNDSDIRELESIIKELRETSADTVRTGVNWRIASDVNEKIEKTAAKLNARKSEVIRAIINRRAQELKAGKSTCKSFSTVSWNINCKNILPVQLLIDEVLKRKSDIFSILGYNKAALGIADLKSLFAEQGFGGIYESAYLPGKRGFLVVYNDKRFKLTAELPGGDSFILPILFRDKVADRDIVFVCVKVPYNDDVDVRTALEKTDKFVCGLKQNEKFKDKEIIVQGDFRAISRKIDEFKVFCSLSLCPSRRDEYSFVYETGFSNKIDHAYISNGLEAVETAYKWDFICEDFYGGITATDYITIDGLPNHAVMVLKLKYK